MTIPNEFPEALVDKLLDKLYGDNEFREVFLRDPRIALAYLGHEGASKASPGDQGAWSCLVCTKLASPEAIKASRDLLRIQLTTSLAAQQPIKLEA